MNKKRFFITVIVFVAIICGLWLLFDSKYYFFGKQLTAEMEEMYGIKVTDNINLKEYKEFGWLSFQYDLTINKINSYEDFLQNNIRSSDIPKPFYNQRPEKLYYSYTWKNNEVYIEFFPQSDNTYTAVLSICE